jgi:predicted alpha/beta superfamily hydrolase
MPEERAMGQTKIQVFYPPTEGRIVLRTELDWERDIEASYVSEDRTISEFVVKAPHHYFYYKPCLVGRERLWSRGANYLATTGTDDIRRIYPLFFAHQHGVFSDPITVRDDHGGHEHKLRVYFPPGYDENTIKRYPVLYMHDGSNLFFPDEAFGGSEWQVDENLEQLDSMSLIDKVIVVGVYARDRMHDYTKPGYEAYGRLLVDKVKPLIDTRLRTLADPASTAVMGSSLGGVVSFFLGWQYPHVFGKAACLSSTFGYRDDLMERVLHEPRRDVRFYIDSGWPEDNYENTTAMRDHLLAAGYRFGRDVLYFAFPGALHNEASWALRSHIPFQFFFGKVPRF